MKIPDRPPKFNTLLTRFTQPNAVEDLLKVLEQFKLDQDYLHWDELRRKPVPDGFSHEEWWFALKFRRKDAYRSLPLLDKTGRPFCFSIPDAVLELLHQIDFMAGSYIGLPDTLMNPQLRDRYVVSSLIQEAITSSQLEGAVATREAAKEMIRSGRSPRDKSERMIFNNYQAMQAITEMKDQPLTAERIFEIHRILTEGTLENASAAGRFRTTNEPVHVVDGEGVVYHDPPPASELPMRMAALCDFANDVSTGKPGYIPPVIRAIILHFWLAYDHPFVDGNGRTARALLYWSMLKQGFWLFEFISISNILVKAPAKYARAFLHTETDENDLTYFILHQTDTIQRAIQALHVFVERKQAEMKDAEMRLKAFPDLNHRQQAMIEHALRHPGQEMAIKGCKETYRVAYATARSDLLGIKEKGLFGVKTRGKEMIFYPVGDLADHLNK